ncbi:hypothetical protein NQ314_003780 [Rhamnusium bicolor]|uniref:Uncharacterized protein n=1 Tax=Rhamnusium bicolor TaxID=1586634 RepID=A0AAV8ZLE7_9CUCU|nr:hypothetical protein NQ314_003780 [Rhamnusium bicolor]
MHKSIGFHLHSGKQLLMQFYFEKQSNQWTLGSLNKNEIFFTQPEKYEGDIEPLPQSETMINQFLIKDNEKHQQ